MNIFRLIIGAGFLVIHLAGIGLAGEPEANMLVRFQEGNALYKAGDFKKAAESYEAALKSGRVSEPLYYNLANSYFKAGQIGRAVLNYERAKRLNPRDPDLLANYNYALSKVKGEPATAPSIFSPKRILSDYSDFFTVDELTLIVFGFFFLTGAVYYAGLFLKWPTRIYVIVVIMSCAIVFFNGAVLFYKLSQERNLAVIIKDSSARFEPLEGATIYFDLEEGQKLKSIGQEDGWFKIKRRDGKLGWVKREVIERI